jgi:hypothetical protein
MRNALTPLLAVMAVRGAVAQAPTRLELVRCAVGSEVPCLRARASLDPIARATAASVDSASERGAWSGELMGTRLAGPGVSVTPGTTSQTQLLILIDRGAAMSGEGIAFARIAVKAWLATLDSTAISVAVAGFDGRNLSQQIGMVAFQSPRAALALVDALPMPAPKEHSPLYTATLLGARRLIAQRDSMRGSVGGLLVITMGQNEIGRGRDGAAFLAGDAGLDQAAAGVSATALRTWIMALGASAPMDELGRLAGTNGSAYAVALDPNAISLRLGAVSREFDGGRELTFGVGALGTGNLGRTAGVGSTRLQVAGHAIRVAVLGWRPPLMALPVFRGVAQPTSLSPALRDALLPGAGGGSNRPFVALLVAVLVAVVWVLVLRLCWGAPMIDGARVRERLATTRTATLGVANDEAPPRKPEDITHQTARRTALGR